MNILLMIHSINRWLIVLVALAAIVKFALGWQQRQTFTSQDRALASAFAGLMDLQFLLGVILLFGLGMNDRFRMEHAVTMLFAVIVAHLPAMWRSAPDDLRFRNTLFAIVGSLLLIIAGVARLQQGWFG
jgi:uncharacterized membrane protein YphA (DoxX/SURF4 family)